MEPTTHLFVGRPLEGPEAAFLVQFCAYLQGDQNLLLANFHTKQRESRQIDLVVITPTKALLLEVKHLTGVVYGDVNGPWRVKNYAGNIVEYDGGNPWQQVVEAKYSLSDDMRDYRRHHPDVPKPLSGHYYSQFDAAVCLHPSIDPASQVSRGNFKAKVYEYSEIVNVIASGCTKSSWDRSVWERFAREHLNLRQVTIAQATDPAAFASDVLVRSYIEGLRRSIEPLPPLPPNEAGESCGIELISQLQEPRHLVLVGPSGSGKTTHIRHLASADSTDEVPILLQARRYRGGDLWPLITKSIAPCTKADAPRLFEAIRMCGLHPLVASDSACREWEDDAAAAGMSPEAYRYAAANGLLGKIFEDVFQDAYYEAYQLLDPIDRRTVLVLAAQDRVGLFTSWILEELIKLDDPITLPAFEYVTTNLDTENVFHQEQAAAFLLGVWGCARWSETPPKVISTTTAHEAWAIIARLAFWLSREQQGHEVDTDDLETSWKQLESHPGAADVFCRLHAVAHSARSARAVLSDLFGSRFHRHLRPLLEWSLQNRESLLSCFPHPPSMFGSLEEWMMDWLGKIGDLKTSIPVLAGMADDRRIGPKAISSIRQLQAKP